MVVSGAGERCTVTSCVPALSPAREAADAKATAGLSSSAMCTTTVRAANSTPGSVVDSATSTDSPTSPCRVSCTVAMARSTRFAFAGTVTERAPRPPATSASDAPPAPESV